MPCCSWDKDDKGYGAMRVYYRRFYLEVRESFPEEGA